MGSFFCDEVERAITWENQQNIYGNIWRCPDKIAPCLQPEFIKHRDGDKSKRSIPVGFDSSEYLDESSKILYLHKV
jgi:hypothetical protein